MTIDRVATLDALAGRCLGDAAIVGAVARTMAELLPITLAGLRPALERGDADDVHRVAHGPKGNATLAGAGRVRERAATVEGLADMGNLGTVRTVPAALAEGCRELVAVVHEIAAGVIA